MNNDLPLTQDLVLVGGGHTHALVLRMWGMNPLPGVRVTVINPGPTAPYSGMLPGFVSGHYSREDLDIDLVRLARFAGARFVDGAAEHVDVVKREVRVPGRPPIKFDIASIDIGITSEMPDLPGFQEHAVPAKPLGRFARRWEEYLETSTTPKIAVIGGGVAGAELAMAIAFAMQQHGKAAHVSLIDSGNVLSGFGPKARTLLLKSISDAGIEIVERASIQKVTDGAVVCADGREVFADFSVGAAGASAHSWIGKTGLELQNGFIVVDAHLQSSEKSVFAVGDCAHMSHAPRPKAGVFAVRQAPILFANLRAALSGGDFKDYQPQTDYLKLISLGRKSALAEKFGTARRGRLLWLWKNRIDLKFMTQFRDLKPMAQPKLPSPVALGVIEALGDKPMCGGCGAKVGRGALREVLDTLPATSRTDVELTPGDDAAIIVTGGVRQIFTTDHLRAFSLDPVQMTRIAAVHALGDCWAMGAKPQAATANLILPRMSKELQSRTMAEIMRTAHDVFGSSGAAIVGGHSSLGSELTIGFSITGLCDGPPITLAGARPGDRLILTKPIGSGVLMAAEMAMLGNGSDVTAALAEMQRSQAVASTILRSNAHAMTDVTGFGLAGHLSGICEASGVAAEIELGRLPILSGAEALAEKGIRSTLFVDNREGAGPVFGATGARGDLLFDPQTAGGLLAAVAPERAEDILHQLWVAGYPAADIGKIQRGTPTITVEP